MKASTTSEVGVIQMLYTLWGDQVNATVQQKKNPPHPPPSPSPVPAPDDK